MGKPKIRKAVVKRFKITRNGKVLRRATGQNHFRAKKSGNKIRAMRRWVLVEGAEAKNIKHFLYR